MCRKVILYKPILLYEKIINNFFLNCDKLERLNSPTLLYYIKEHIFETISTRFTNSSSLIILHIKKII